MFRFEFCPMARASASMVSSYLVQCAGFACGVVVGTASELWRRAWDR